MSIYKSVLYKNTYLSRLTTCDVSKAITPYLSPQELHPYSYGSLVHLYIYLLKGNSVS